MEKPEQLFDIAYRLGADMDPHISPYTFAVRVAEEACKQHVQAALLAAIQTAKIIYTPDEIIDRVGILNSYPLDNIK